MREWAIRDASPIDIAFIYSSWLKSYKNGCLKGVRTTAPIFYDYYTRIIDKIASRTDIKISIACHLVEQTTLFGYIIYQEELLHYIYVKKPFRKNGIARDLFEIAGSPKLYTHKTKTSVDILKKYPELQFNPFRLYYY